MSQPGEHSSTRPRPRPRARDLGLTFGPFSTGRHNAITDVPGVRVGHVTLWHGDPSSGEPVARTGVTAIVPAAPKDLFDHPMPAAVSVLNGAGELTGTIELAEFGVLETPLLLTGTASVPRVADGIIDELFAAGVDEAIIPIVGECDDSHLDELHRRWVTPAHARESIAAATDGPVPEGVVGAGSGMITMGHKAGIGTASRHLPGVGTIGVLLLCNFGALRDLRIGGVLVGESLAADAAVAADALPPAPTLDQGGSCLGVVFTDIPLDARQLRRVAQRVGLGLARVGSVAHHGSGEIFCAISTANRVGRHHTGTVAIELLADGSLNDIFHAVVDATEEAACNALFVADTVVGVGGTIVPGLPVDRVLELIAQRRP
jgi:D-aminopeptidase